MSGSVCAHPADDFRQNRWQTGPAHLDWLSLSNYSISEIRLQGVTLSVTIRVTNKDKHINTVTSLSFGDWLRRRRKALDWTQAELARRVSCTAATIRKIEANERKPSRQLAELLAEQLGVPLDQRTAFLNAARQSVAPDDARDLPARGSPRTNLPAPVNALIGREHDAIRLRNDCLARDKRLITLIGPPGVGKTRLALQLAWDVAAHFADGAYWIDLSPITEPASVLAALHEALNLPELSSDPSITLAQLRDALCDRRVLLILDNFEQVLPAALPVSQLLEAAPRLTVLATSRSPLRVYGEHEWRVLPLPLPDLAQLPPVPELAQIPSVELFVARAQSVQADFQLTPDNALAVAASVVQLDGLPLAIELAVPQLKTLSPQELAARLVNRLATLTHGPRNRSTRQQTLRGAIEWSYQRLPADQQRLFAQLGVFVGGFTGEAVAAVCESDRLIDLIESNLVHLAANGDQTRRFNLLDTLREYALEQLSASGEEQAVRARHARYFLELAETAEPQLVGADQAVWLQRLAAEQANFHAALRWAQAADENLIGLRLSAALWRFWWMHSHLSEGRRWLTHFIEAPTGGGAELYRATALHGAGVLAYHQADYAEARARLERSLSICRACGDWRGAAYALNSLGVVASYQHQSAQAVEFHSAALEIRRQLGDQRGVAISLNNLGLVAHFQEDYPRAIDLFQQSIALFEALGDVRVKSAVLSNLGRALTGQGEYSQAKMCLRQSLRMVWNLGNREDSIEAIEALAGVAGATGEAIRGAMLLGAAEALREKIQSPVALVARREYDRDLIHTKDQLSPGLFAAAWAKGRVMTLEEAVELALSERAQSPTVE